MKLRIGVDFDNTIVSYDGVFHKVALEQKLIPVELDSSKDSVRNHLRATNREEDWTALQGHVYGARMDVAQPYAGVREFFRRCVENNVDVFIVSHKTLRPYLGVPHDLHKSAREWLERQGFFDPNLIGLDPSRVFFELTKREKIARISALSCTVFIDDLPEFLSEPNFPVDIERLLFDPKDENRDCTAFARLRSWNELNTLLLRHFDMPGDHDH